jgi:outer membrane protein assembly factor BamD (BamD/ComL family)
MNRNTKPMSGMRVVVGLLACVWLVPGALGDRAQEEHYRERQVLDGETGTWVTQERPPEQGPADALDESRGLLAEGRPKKARKRIEAWLDAHPESERYFEAMWLLGETYFETRDYWKAVEHYQLVAESASGEVFHRANERSVRVAQAFLSGQKRRVWKVLRLPAYDEGVEILDRVWQREPGTRLGEMSLKLKADHFFERGEVELAYDEYANLVMQYPSGRYVQLGMLRTAEAAEAAFPGIRFDDRPLLDAAERYRQLQATFPAYAQHENVGERLDGIQEKRAAKDLDIGRWYERTRRPDAAAYYYREIMADWPGTLAAAEARTRLQGLGMEPVSAEEREP